MLMTPDSKDDYFISIRREAGLKKLAGFQDAQVFDWARSTAVHPGRRGGALGPALRWLGKSEQVV
jgi:hypothetical protein